MVANILATYIVITADGSIRARGTPASTTTQLRRKDLTEGVLKLWLDTGQDFNRLVLKYTVSQHVQLWLNVSRTQSRVCTAAPSSLSA
jgi:hypothetical protein